MDPSKALKRTNMERILWLGQRTRRNLSEGRFRRVFFSMLLLPGAYIAVRAFLLYGLRRLNHRPDRRRRVGDLLHGDVEVGDGAHIRHPSAQSLRPASAPTMRAIRIAI